MTKAKQPNAAEAIRRVANYMIAQAKIMLREADEIERLTKF